MPVIKFPKNQVVPDVTVSIPIIKLQKYSKDEIFDKKLLMFIHFYILQFEKRISKIENDMQELSELKKEYDYIYSSLKKLNENKYIDDVYYNVPYKVDTTRERDCLKC